MSNQGSSLPRNESAVNKAVSFQNTKPPPKGLRQWHARLQRGCGIGFRKAQSARVRAHPQSVHDRSHPQRCAVSKRPLGDEALRQTVAPRRRTRHAHMQRCRRCMRRRSIRHGRRLSARREEQHAGRETTGASHAEHPIITALAPKFRLALGGAGERKASPERSGVAGGGPVDHWLDRASTMHRVLRRSES